MRYAMTVGNKHRLLSIVIPTHNRFRYASHAIGNVLSIQSDEMEMIVHDTSDDDELESWICSNVSDPRLTYRHVKPPLSMTENHNAAVSLASGDYICLIGDDDGVNPEIMESARWAKELGLDALTPVISATYSWGDFSTRLLGDRHARKLYIGVISGKYRFERVDNALDRCLKNACQGTDGLPKIYHGIVRRTCLQDVYAKTGAFFFGVSPDVSGAIALAPHVKKFCVIDYPLTIPGASGGSNTGRSALNQHKGSLDDDPHMKPFKNVNWPDLVPRFFSVQTVWAGGARSASSIGAR